MYILYLDESGIHGEAAYFVLAGLAVFEREIHWFSQDLDLLQREYFPEEAEPVFFHAARLRVRENAVVAPPWDRLTAEQRRSLKDRVFDVIRERRAVLFACAVEKAFARLRGEDPYERAFEDLISRFDRFMSRINQQAAAEGQKNSVVWSFLPSLVTRRTWLFWPGNCEGKAPVGAICTTSPMSLSLPQHRTRGCCSMPISALTQSMVDTMPSSRVILTVSPASLTGKQA